MNPKADIKLLKLDLSSLQSVRHFAKELSQLESKVDILINNAGVYGCPEWQTTDGFEMQMGTNHLGHFLLTLHLLPLLKKSSSARVVTVSSCMHLLGDINIENIHLRNGTYEPVKAYSNSKLANVLFSRELAKRLDKTNINTYSLHPGVIQTDIQRHSKSGDKANVGIVDRYFSLTPSMGSQTTLYCALDESLDNESGFYYDNCRRVDRMVAEARDDSMARQLWDLSCDLVKLEDHLKI
ncbi:unnamed protein product [Oppiella nova]|uniref:Uncharacterized protein n=1 Tax=Oppiella nova TaxID=334625 RepID=A0A7R9M767_9ACAR|nr:unnamed protein product [Oppiella nova]CAG2171504.1 unnamed protein product [Oppiella nova]